MSELKFSIVGNSMRRWRLLEDFNVRIRVGVKVQSVVVPRYFVTDFASVPRIFHVIFPPAGKYGIAAMVHDYLCESEVVSRKEADLAFYDLMMKNDVRPWKAKVMFAAARTYAVLSGIDRRERKAREVAAP